MEDVADCLKGTILAMSSLGSNPYSCFHYVLQVLNSSWPCSCGPLLVFEEEYLTFIGCSHIFQHSSLGQPPSLWSSDLSPFSNVLVRFLWVFSLLKWCFILVRTHLMLVFGSPSPHVFVIATLSALNPCWLVF